MDMHFLATFWVSLPAVSGGATTVYNMDAMHLHWTQDTLVICTSSMGFFIMCLCIGICQAIAEPIVSCLLYLCCCSGGRETPSVLRALLVLVMGTCLCTPVYVGIFGLCIGSLMAWV